MTDSNIINKKPIFDEMIKTLDELVGILKAHCGPLSDYAVLLDSNNPNAEPIFTKDGINIIRGVRYKDMVKEFTRSSLQYIGGRVETSAGDGTTSAMIICATMLKVLLEEVQKASHACSTTEYAMLFDKFKKKMGEYYDSKFLGIKECEFDSEETQIKVIKNIAYWQAYTSSHGDLELSEAISKLFANTPIGAWDGLTIESSRYETKFRYKTEVDTSQYTLENVRPFPVSQITSKLGLECNRDNTRTIISDMAPCMALVDTADLIKKIDEAIQSGEELTVICPDEFRDAPTIYHFDELFKAHPDHKVVFFFVNCRDKMNDVVGTKILGIPGLNENGEHTLTYNFSGSTLKINEGLYPKTDKTLYPYKDITAYKELLEQVNEVIHGLTTAVANLDTTRALTHIRKFLFKLTVIKRPSLILGGGSYDNVASVDVAVDAISATKKSLTNGFVLGGNKSLYQAVLDLRDVLLKDEEPHYKWFMNAIFKALLISIETVYDCVYTPIRKGKKKSIAYQYSENILDRSQSAKKFVPELVLDDNRYPVIIQPKNMDLELITRFGEVALKFLKIDKIIARV